MKVLVIGSGGREHAICWKLAESPMVDKVFCAPGNAGIAAVAELVDIKAANLKALADFAENRGMDYTMVGPEVPLCAGIVDIFMKRGLRVFGPAAAAAKLEGSKAFAKKFMEDYDIPTAAAAVFESAAPALEYVKSRFAAGEPGVVVKADGLAAGKGVIVALDMEKALAAVEDCFGGAFDGAGAKVVVEELLRGEEASILALVDGETIVPLASSQDHKRLLDGDAGPNTGGMGAYSPAPVVDDALMEQINRMVLDNFLRGVKEMNLHFRGIIYAGIMVTESGPKVLEFNVRFGDPETQAVLARLDDDFFEMMRKTIHGELAGYTPKWSDEPAVCVVMASGGYPGAYEKGYPISGLAAAERSGAIVFHAGTAAVDGRIVNAGGRVLGVTAKGADIAAAIGNAYQAAEEISWRDCFFRRDIAHRALDRRDKTGD